jgi:hypothetical protein
MKIEDNNKLVLWDSEDYKYSQIEFVQRQKMSKIKWFLQSLKKKFTPLRYLQEKVEYNPFVDNSAYIKDLIWEYSPILNYKYSVQVNTSFKGVDIFENVASGIKHVKVYGWNKKPYGHTMPNTKYDIVDYEFDVYFNGNFLFTLIPHI